MGAIDDEEDDEREDGDGSEELESVEVRFNEICFIIFSRKFEYW